MVGESGSGKSTMARCVTLLEKPDSGSIVFLGRDWVNMDETERKPLRKEMQIIFQDPYSSLSPRRRTSDIVCEPLIAQKLIPKGDIQEKARDLLRTVGLDDDFLRKYPHEMSGGQRQRVAIGRALSTSPKLIIADEPVSSLDVSIQAQIINLFLDIKERLAISFLFISHDLSIVRFLSDTIMVMYKGKVLERAPKDEIFGNPLHPYTRMLIASGNGAGPEPQGSTTDACATGCPFVDRCEERKPACSESAPVTKTIGEHHVVCHCL